MWAVNNQAMGLFSVLNRYLTLLNLKGIFFLPTVIFIMFYTSGLYYSSSVYVPVVKSGSEFLLKWSHLMEVGKWQSFNIPMTSVGLKNIKLIFKNTRIW